MDIVLQILLKTNTSNVLLLFAFVPFLLAWKEIFVLLNNLICFLLESFFHSRPLLAYYKEIVFYFLLICFLTFFFGGSSSIAFLKSFHELLSKNKIHCKKLGYLGSSLFLLKCFLSQFPTFSVCLKVFFY